MSESTIEYYHKRKRTLQIEILEHNEPEDLEEDCDPYCQVCGKTKGQVKELHIEHPNGDGDHSEDEGGWQKVYKYEEHFEEGRELWVVCDVCHYLLHRKRDDDGQYVLQKGRPWLRDYQDIDPAFELKQRRKMRKSGTSSSS